MRLDLATIGVLAAVLGAALADAQDRASSALDPCASIMPTAPEADACAEVAFDAAAAEASPSSTVALPYAGMRADTARAVVVAQVRTAWARAQTIATRYDRVVAWGSPYWTSRALYEQAVAYLALCEALHYTRSVVRVRGALDPELGALLDQQIHASRSAFVRLLHAAEAAFVEYGETSAHPAVER